MLEGWRRATIEDLAEMVSVRGHQAQTNEYAKKGTWPIVDQGQSNIVGYSDTHEPIRHPLPLVLFGDHTRIVKMVRHPFVVGADGVKLLTAKENVADAEFLYFLIATAANQIQSLGYARHFKELKEFTFRLPPLPEQRKIAEILRTWDEAIEKLEALRAANLRRRIWMRSHLFTGRARLPGFSGEWREVALGEVLTEHGLQGTGAEEVFSVSVHKGLVNQIEHLGRSFATAETGHYNRVLPGDIVYTKSPTGDFPLGIIKQSKISQEVIVSPLYGVFTPATRELGVILDALFESPLAVRNYLHPLVQKGAKNTIAITNRRFLEGRLRLPMDPAEQAAIAAVVEVSQAELNAIVSEIDLLTRQKRGLMQKLLTGEWRVQEEVAA